MYELKICSLDDACVKYRLWPTHTISLLDPKHVIEQRDRQLILRFNDIDRSRYDALENGMMFGEEWVLACENDLQDIARFVADLTDDSRVLIHCHAGIGRSPAVAMFVLMLYGQSYINAFNEVRKIRPQLWPNMRVVELTDDYFSLGGAMVRFVKAWREERRDSIFIVDDE